MNINVLLYVVNAIATRFSAFFPMFQVKATCDCPGSASGECDQEFVGSNENLH